MYNKSFCYKGDIVEYQGGYFRCIGKRKSNFILYMFQSLSYRGTESSSIWWMVFHIEVRRHDLEEGARLLDVSEKARVLLEYV